MYVNPSEWLNLVVRWIHVFAGILWVGQTYYFTWLDGRFTELERGRRDASPARVWMVHSGGFYVSEKQATLAVRPEHLRWFRWEAALTWLSGFVLLVLVYYLGGTMVDPQVADVSVGAASGIGLAALAIGWVAYDLLARSRMARSEKAFAGVALLLVMLASFGLSRVMSGRATYMHVGAMLGTIMAANVWMRILPAQRRMVAAAGAGVPFDPALAAQAKIRSKHNTFMAVPVVFIMISNHFPTATYGSAYNWIVLSVLVVAGWVAAGLIRRA